MPSYEFISDVLHELRDELKHQSSFIEKLRNYNKELDSKGFRIAYSLKTLADELEKNSSAVNRAMANLPMEEDQVD